jgi:hypothetical protein
MKLSTLTRSLLAVVLCAAVLPAQAQFGGVRNLIQDVQRATQPPAPPAMPSEGGGMPPAAPAAAGAQAPAAAAPGAGASPTPRGAGAHDFAAWSHDMAPAPQKSPYVVVPALRIHAFSNPCSSGGGRCWVPQIYLPMVGSLPASAEVHVSYSHGGKAWFVDKFKRSEGHPQSATTSNTAIYRFSPIGVRSGDKAARHIGRVDFDVEVRDPLNAGAANKLFKGHFIAGREPTGFGDHDYYVSYDWATEVLLLDVLGARYGANHATEMPTLGVSGVFLQPKDVTESSSIHLFYNGKEIASSTGAAIIWDQKARNTQTKSGYGVLQLRWTLPTVAAYNQTTPNSDTFLLSSNPGSYTIKIIRNGEIAREAQFTVGADGKLDRTMNVAGNMPHGFTIIPAKVLGTGDGKRRDSYKTEGFYGNPVAKP